MVEPFEALSWKALAEFSDNPELFTKFSESMIPSELLADTPTKGIVFVLQTAFNGSSPQTISNA